MTMARIIEAANADVAGVFVVRCSPTLTGKPVCVADYRDMTSALRFAVSLLRPEWTGHAAGRC